MKDWWKIAFAVACGLLAAGAITLASRPPRGEPITLLPPPTPAPLVVHVAGAVQNPDVYELPLGSRVGDAIDAAGGLLEGANPGGLNLAAFLEDGERLYVPQLPTPLPEAPASNRSGALPTEIPPPSTDQRININTASQAELETLPGIGPVTAEKIIAYRESNGYFKIIEEIMDVPGIGTKKFEDIKDLITVE